MTIISKWGIEMRILNGMILASAFGFATSAYALEYPIGEPQFGGGMEVAAVYLQPIEMEPAGMMLAAEKADVHIEADIHATKDNVNGFANGDWMPYLDISFELTKDGKSVAKGPLMGMVASDGPHYGDNVKLDGPGIYKLTFHIAPPAGTGHMPFGRHVDKETGVAPWFAPFDTNYEFTYAGTGKKGGY
ncbi:MAG: rane protein [Proteobacteria bacterium]|nr:rane protein [Pseudomonadota bacterium]